MGWMDGLMDGWDGWMGRWTDGMGWDGWAMDGWMASWQVGWLNGRMAGWLAGWMDGWMDAWMDGWLVGWLEGWLNGWLGSQCEEKEASPYMQVRRMVTLKGSTSVPMKGLYYRPCCGQWQGWTGTVTIYCIVTNRFLGMCQWWFTGATHASPTHTHTHTHQWPRIIVVWWVDKVPNTARLALKRSHYAVASAWGCYEITVLTHHSPMCSIVHPMFVHLASCFWCMINATLGKKATIHQATTTLATSKNVLSPGHNHMLTTCAASEGSSAPVLSRWLRPGNRICLKVDNMVVTWWIVAFLLSVVQWWVSTMCCTDFKGNISSSAYVVFSTVGKLDNWE